MGRSIQSNLGFQMQMEDWARQTSKNIQTMSMNQVQLHRAYTTKAEGEIITQSVINLTDKQQSI